MTKGNGYNRLLVIGDLMLDCDCHGQTERIAPEGDCPVVTCQKIEYHPGGAAKVAFFAARLGASVSLVGIVGDDSEGRMLTTLLNDAGVDTRDVIIDPEAATTVKNRIYGSAGGLMLRVDRDCHEGTKDIATLLAKIDNVDAVVISDYDKGVVTTALGRAVIDRCHHLGIPVIADVKRPEVDRYAGATLVKGTRNEIEPLLNAGDLNVRFVVSTGGHEGVSLSLDNGGSWTQFVPSMVASAHSPAGAGDLMTALVALNFGRHGIETVMADAVETISRSITPDGRLRVDVRSVVNPRTKLTTVGQFNRLRPEGTVVFTNGCFDLLHPGHFHLLAEAARSGDCLVVGLNSDSSVARLKGESRPVNKLDSRVRALAALPWVDAIITFDTDTPARLISEIHPDILVKGGDYTVDTIVGANDVIAAGGKVVIVDTLEGYSSTGIINSCVHEP